MRLSKLTALCLMSTVLCCAGLSGAGAAAEPMTFVVDHTCTALNKIPADWIKKAKSSLHIAYGHTSHGSQLLSGMDGLMRWKGNAYGWSAGRAKGLLDIRDSPFDGADDLGSPDATTWALATKSYLKINPDINVVMWSWCGQLSWFSEKDVDKYLSLMSSLEKAYPKVKFVYMTGHLDGTGVSGALNKRNNQIRQYCKKNGKWLYDFADIEAYDPDGNSYLAKLANDNCDYDSDKDGSQDKNWAMDWQSNHTENKDWYDCEVAHSQPLNGNLKAYAAWWLFARLAGWDGAPVR